MKQVLMVDPSVLRSSGCERELYMKCVEGHRPKVFANDMEFGSAFHAFTEKLAGNPDNLGEALKEAKHYYLTKPMYVKPKKQYMDVKFLLRCCIEYCNSVAENDPFKTCELEGKPLVEKRFNIPWYEDDDIIVLFCGTIDRICKRDKGVFAISDYKTTSMWDIQAYFRAYDLSSQLMSYYIAVEHYAEEFPDSIFAEMKRTNFACFIDGIFLKGKDKPIEFARSEMFFFPKEQIEEYKQLLDEKIHRLVGYVKLNKRPLRQGMLNGCCDKPYGPCSFFSICSLNNPRVAQLKLLKDFTQVDYNPNTHGTL